MNVFKKYAILSLGILLSTLSVLFLKRFVGALELDLEFIFESIENWMEFSPYLLIGLLLGFVGIPLFMVGLEKSKGRDL